MLRHLGDGFMVSPRRRSGKLVAVVSFSQEQAYAATVAAAGASKFLVQQYVDRYVHCNLKPEEILNSFQGLLLWVTLGELWHHASGRRCDRAAAQDAIGHS